MPKVGLLVLGLQPARGIAPKAVGLTNVKPPRIATKIYATIRSRIAPTMLLQTPLQMPDLRNPWASDGDRCGRSIGINEEPFAIR